MAFSILKNRMFSIIMATTISVAAIFPITMPETASIDFQLPGQGKYDEMLNAAVTIKTQKAADKIEDGIRGIDVSKYQGEINWSKVASDDVQFAFIRASCGVILGGKYQLNEDPMFITNARGAYENGLKVGAYHYACLTSESRMRSEAALFIKMLKQVKITYPVVLDVESNPGRLSRTELARLAKGFADLVKAEGYDVMVYSYQNFFRDSLDVKGLGNHKLWVANYGETPKSITHSMWQHTSSGRVKGINGNVDINIAYPDFQPKRWKSVTVSKKISDPIKDRLRSKYRLDVPATGLSGIHENVISALQMELNKQLGANVRVDGKMDRECLQLLADIPFGSGTKGNITYLVQARLFYLGFYKVTPSAQFDGRTSEALRDFQYANNLAVNGKMDRDTVYALFG